MEEHGEKVDPTTIEAIELAIAALKDDLEKDDVSADKIKAGIQNVTEVAMRLGEASTRLLRKKAKSRNQPVPMKWQAKAKTMISSMQTSKTSTKTSARKR